MQLVYGYEGFICSDLKEVKPFLNETLLKLKNFISDEEVLYDIKLILDELIVNGILHGNCKDICKYVYLKVILRESSITIAVRDEGVGINYDFEDIEFSSDKCCGRGLILVKALTDSLVLDKNTIIVMKKL